MKRLMVMMNMMVRIPNTRTAKAHFEDIGFFYYSLIVFNFLPNINNQLVAGKLIKKPFGPPISC